MSVSNVIVADHSALGQSRSNSPRRHANRQHTRRGQVRTVRRSTIPLRRVTRILSTSVALRRKNTRVTGHTGYAGRGTHCGQRPPATNLRQQIVNRSRCNGQTGRNRRRQTGRAFSKLLQQGTQTRLILTRPYTNGRAAHVERYERRRRRSNVNGEVVIRHRQGSSTTNRRQGMRRNRRKGYRVTRPKIVLFATIIVM